MVIIFRDGEGKLNCEGIENYSLLNYKGNLIVLRERIRNILFYFIWLFLFFK